jgi:predicted glycogen debranching enzyme
MPDNFDTEAEWLEADGRGGFASGTVGGERTRCYHALLLTATTPPTGRYVLVNGFEAWLEGPGRIFLSTQRYLPDIVYPDGVSRLQAFEATPWPTWRFAISDTETVQFELFVTKESCETVLRWKKVAASSASSNSSVSSSPSIPRTPPTEPTEPTEPIAPTEPGRATERAQSAQAALPGSRRVLKVRLLLSGRDYHGLHHENPVFDFSFHRAGASEGEVAGNIEWQPYSGLPAITALSNGRYDHAPDWFRRFFYRAEHARGLDDSEDLASPGVFSFDPEAGEAVIILRTGKTLDDDAVTRAGMLAAQEQTRRQAFAGETARAADTYLVERGAGRTLLAGFPWFTDWGRDTFIAMRGLMIATGRLAEAEAILLGWAGVVSEGMMPNRFPDDGGEPEYNSVDASLWFIVAVYDYLASGHATAQTQARLRQAAGEILDGYARGTRFGIAADADGLIRAGVPGVQLTWMDAKVGDWVVTPRIGKPVEIQALWLNALRIAREWTQDWHTLEQGASDAFRARFIDPQTGGLFDVVDADHEVGKLDRAIRPNQIFALGGLPFSVLDGENAQRVVAQVEAELLTPLGLRSLSPRDPAYRGRYEGDRVQRDGAYHQGTVWPWLAGPFVEAWLRVKGASAASRNEAATRFLAPLRAHLRTAGLGHVSEIADGDVPHTPKGAPFQAWSLGELIRIERLIAG